MVVPPLSLGEDQTTGGSSPPADALPALRSKMRKLRQQFDCERFWLPAVLPQSLLEAFAEAEALGLYAPMNGEPDPISIASPQDCVMSLPALLPNDRMVFRRWNVGDALVGSPWSGQQPASTAEIVMPDVILVPLVAFDEKLNRLGQGGGHYDRYFADHPTARRIGVAWEAQRLQMLPVREWDMPLDAVITEKTCYLKDTTDA